MAGSRVTDIVNAAVDALQGDALLTSALGSAKNYTNVPATTQPPYNLVLGGDEAPWAVEFGDDVGGRTIDLSVECYTKYRGSTQVDGIASHVMDVLLDQGTWNSVDGYQAVDFLRNAALPPQTLTDDGEPWYVRRVTVRVTVG